MLTFLIVLPFVVALLLSVLPEAWSRLRWAPLGVSLVQLALSIFLYVHFQPAQAGFQFVEQHAWFSFTSGGKIFQADYLVGVDGLSLSLVMLSSLLLVIASLSSWLVKKNVKSFDILFLILNGAILGTFCAIDSLLFFIFFEFLLIPAYFIIGRWGGERRETASIKFILFTFFGSILILLAFILLFLSHSANGQLFSFDVRMWSQASSLLQDSWLSTDMPQTLLGISLRTWAFSLLVVGFLIKLPSFPFHSWLPDAHVEAPTSLSVLLAGVLLKIGAYGLIRFAFPLFSDVAQMGQPLLMALGMFSILYGAWCAFSSTDLKKLIAYSSVSHMGFVLMGIASCSAEGLAGASYQLISHGILSALLFVLAGVLYERTGDRTIAHYSGLSEPMSRYASFSLIAFFASLGLPGFSGFIAEFFVLSGVLQQGAVWLAVLTGLGIVLTAGYFLWTYQRMFLGSFFQKGNASLPDLTTREWLQILPLVLLTFLLGILPNGLLTLFNQFMHEWLTLFC